MGGGGTTGNVRFPKYVEDVHGYLYAGEEVDSGGGGGFESSAWLKPTENVTKIMNAMWAAANPWGALSFTDPATDLAASKAQFDLYYAAVTSYDDDNYADYIADAILAIGNSTTVPIANLAASLSTAAITAPTTSYAPLIAAGRTAAAANLTNMFSNVQPDVQALMVDAPSTALAAVTLTAATTMWDSLVDTVSTKLQTCGIPKNANLLTVLTKAAQDAEQNLRTAITLTKRLIDNDLIGDLSNEFASRREIDFARQHRQYAGTMADINAINSTGFLFGTALLRAEQLREVGEFDAQLSFSQFQQGLSAYMQMHGNALTAGLGIEQQNAEAHNRLLDASIRLLTTLNTRGEILPADLVSLYGQFFANELGMYDNSLRDATGVGAGLFNTEGSLFGISSGDQLKRDSILSQFSLEAARVNKLAYEQRYQLGMQQIQQILANRVNFEQLASQQLTEQNRVKIVATREYDALSNDASIEEAYYDLTVARKGADIMVAPGGMATAIPNKPSAAASALGGAMSGAAAGAALGSVVPGIGTLAGAIGGGIIGGIGGLLQ